MTDPTKPASHHRRRFLRFSVRGMIVIVLVVGGLFGWLVRGVRIQRDAVAAITKSGGSVTYDWEWKDRAPVPGARPRRPVARGSPRSRLFRSRHERLVLERGA